MKQGGGLGRARIVQNTITTPATAVTSGIEVDGAINGLALLGNEIRGQWYGVILQTSTIKNVLVVGNLLMGNQTNFYAVPGVTGTVMTGNVLSAGDPLPPPAPPR